ncbi:transposase IS4 family protein [Natrinema limicola JCM 13563]|uniref:Transposase IS4 family protein n=1 Tax=Natrinema limicola JCM 13563 TaxID=1230457 RepID=M0CFP1_9EURY|nr:transposase IS4 family protein [Natrinema limicola JCM 13563]
MLCRIARRHRLNHVIFTRECVTKAKDVVENPDEPADPEGGGGFAEWAMLTLQALRIELGKSSRQTIDLLSEIPGILEEISLTRLPHFTVPRRNTTGRSVRRFSA